jgi:hypothetical protein
LELAPSDWSWGRCGAGLALKCALSISLGVHILAARASDLIAEGAVDIEFAASVEDLALSVHTHPTLPKAIKEASLAVLKRAIHA